jgi:hypothetical protein
METSFHECLDVQPNYVTHFGFLTLIWFDRFHFLRPVQEISYRLHMTDLRKANTGSSSLLTGPQSSLKRMASRVMAYLSNPCIYSLKSMIILLQDMDLA